MTAVGPAPARASPSRPAAGPYCGVRPFTEADAAYFFGRDADREIITANVIASRLTLLYAPSGVGKTSVLLAGVVHDLRELAHENGRPEYVPVAVRRWSGDPIAAIDGAIARAAGAFGGAPPAEPPHDDRLVDRIGGWADRTGATLLLFLDQFEEFLLYHGDDWSPGGAAREIAQLLSARDLQANVLLGLREDALASLDRFKGRVPHLFENYLRLAHLDVDGGREAILGPIAQWNREHPDDRMEIDPALADTVLEEVATGRITLGSNGGGAVDTTSAGGVEAPFLQLVMERLWDHERGRGSRSLRLETLQSLGGATEIVSSHLDVHMARLSRRERDVAAAAFHQLVTPSGAKVARSVEDLAAYSSASSAEVAAVLETMSQADWRIVRRVDDAGTYEVFHDVLAEAIREWRARHEEQRRRARIVRRALLAGGAAVLVAVLALLFAAWVDGQREEAQRQRDRAAEASRGAESRALAAAAQLRFGLDHERAVATAVRAVGTAETTEAMRALRGALAQNDLRGTLEGKPGPVRSMRLSLDGRTLAVVGDDRRVRVWTLSRPDRRVTLPQTVAAESVALGPRDGRVAAGGDGSVFVWSASGPRVRHRLTYPGGRLRSVLWSPRGDRLLAFGPGGVRVWDADSGRVVKDVPAAAVAEWSAGGTRFATATRGGAVQVWGADGRLMRAMGGRGAVQTLGFNGDGSRVVAVHRNGAVSILGRPGCPRQGQGVTVAAVARNGRYVALGGGPSVRVLDLGAGGACRLVELPNPLHVNTAAVALAPDGSVVVVANDDGIARVYDVRNRAQVATLFAGWQETARVSMRDSAGGGQLIFTAGDDGRVRQWQLGALPLSERFGADRVKAAAIRADGRLVGLVGDRVLATRWERAGAGRRVAAAPGAAAAVFDRQGERLAYTTRRGSLFVVEPGGAPRQIGGPRAGRGVTGLAFDADGGQLVTALRSGALRVWDAQTGASLQSVSAGSDARGPAYATFAAGGALVLANRDVTVHPPGAGAERSLAGPTRVAAAPPGGTPVAASSQGQLAVAFEGAAPRVWRDLGGALPVVLDRAGRLVSALAFSPGGDVIATAGRNGVRLLDPASGQALALLSASSFDRVAFSADGRWVVATGRRSGVQVFACRACGEREQLLARVETMRALVPVAPLAVTTDAALASPPRVDTPPAAAPQANAPLVAPILPDRPLLPITPAPVPDPLPAPTNPSPSDGGGGGGGPPVTGGGGED